MKTKLYKITFLIMEGKNELNNFETITVVATCAEEAINKVKKKMSRGMAIESVNFLHDIDQL